MDGTITKVKSSCGIDLEVIRNDGWKTVLRILGALVVVLATWFVTKQREIFVNSKAYKPMALKPGERKNTVLMIGLGRVGKTHLIDAVIADGISDSTIKLTEKFDIHHFSDMKSNGQSISYAITDYKGQTLKQLIENFVKAQLIPFSKLRYGDINSLLIVVDLFQWKENEDEKKQYDNIAMERVSEHLSEWSRTAIDAIFGLLTSPELKIVCLFINKVDKWKSPLGQKDKEKEIKKHFKALIDDLLTRVHPQGERRFSR